VNRCTFSCKPASSTTCASGSMRSRETDTGFLRPPGPTSATSTSARGQSGPRVPMLRRLQLPPRRSIQGFGTAGSSASTRRAIARNIATP
jgi:hypothetical protein